MNNKLDFLLSDFKNPNQINSAKNNFLKETKNYSKYTKHNLFLGKLYSFYSNLVFSFNIFVLKTLSNHNENYNRFVLNSIRFFTLFVFSFYLMNKKGIKNKSFSDIKVNNLIWHLIKNFLNFFSLFCWTHALYYIRISTASCIFMIHPILTNIFSLFFFQEKFQMKNFIGCFFCFLGCLFYICSENIGKENNYSYAIYFGVFLCFLNAIIWSIVIISGKKLLKEFDSCEINFISGYFVGIMSLILGIVLTGENFIGDLFDLKIFVCSIISGLLMSLGYHYINLSSELADLSKMSYINYSQVVLNIFYGVIFYEENFSLTDLIGSILIIGSNLYMTIKKD